MAGSLASVDPRCVRAGAVCFRIERGRLRFLLVKTTDGGFWTFPKGHVEPREAPWEAASREAKEEAGAEGHPLPEALTVYRYPGGGAACPDILVEAFLLEVQQEKTPAVQERHRERRWVNPADAKELLTDGRSPVYALEGIRLIDEARKAVAARRRRRPSG
jgi:8-oxo-dGTP pyrophosphatase MutT (NUDIX family)